MLDHFGAGGGLSAGFVIGLAIVCNFALTGSANAQQAPLATNLCAVWASPSQFNGREIAVTVQFESDGVHTTSLFDRKCAGKGATPKFGRMRADDPGFQALKEALTIGGEGTGSLGGKTITATFTGTFFFNPTPNVWAILEITKVSNVVVRRLNGSPK